MTTKSLTSRFIFIIVYKTLNEGHRMSIFCGVSFTLISKISVFIQIYILQESSLYYYMELRSNYVSRPFGFRPIFLFIIFLYACNRSNIFSMNPSLITLLQ